MNPVDEIQETLYSLEKRLLLPEVRHSRAELEALLRDDFIEFGGSGDIYDREAIITSLASEPPQVISITDFKMRLITSDVALVTYTASGQTDDGRLRRSLRSSIWQITDGTWRMIFHQGTPILQSLSQ